MINIALKQKYPNITPISKELYEQLLVYSDITRRTDHSYIGHSARWVAKSGTRGLWS